MSSCTLRSGQGRLHHRGAEADEGRAWRIVLGRVALQLAHLDIKGVEWAHLGES